MNSELFLLNTKGIYNVNSSCFMDTVLMSMFSYEHSPFFGFFNENWNFVNDSTDEINRKNIEIEDLKIRKHIQKILRFSIQKVVKNEKIECSELRRIIEQFFIWKGISTNNLSYGQQDISEFYDRIVKIFNFNPIVIINVRQSKVSENSKIIKEKPIIEKMAYISIPNDGSDFDGLKRILNPPWEDLGENKNNWKYNKKDKPTYRFTRNKIQSVKPHGCLVFYINRTSYKQFKDGIKLYKTNNKISMPTYINFENSRYFLFSCIVHIGSISGGHYISIFFDCKNYYIYDDLNLQTIGDTKIDKSKIEDYRNRNSVMYFYYKMFN